MSSSVQDVRATRPGRGSVRGLVTRVAERVTTPLLPADYLDLFGASALEAARDRAQELSR